MLTAVIDTNVFISSALLPHSTPDQIINAWQNHQFVLITSKSIVEEIRQVFTYKKIRKRCSKSDEEINEFITRIQESGIQTPEKLQLEIIEDDPTDDKFIIAAVEGQADYIVSGDSHLLELGSYENIQIVTPRQFIDILDKEAGNK